MNIPIRKATLGDFQAVQKLSQELFLSDMPSDPLLNSQWTYQKEGESYFTKRITGTEGICFVAEFDGAVIGYVTGNIMEVLSWRPVRRLEMENLIVTVSYRGKRIGEQLAQKLFDWGKHLGMERVTVTAYAINEGGIRFYKRIGFIPDSLLLEKTLD